MACGAGRRLRSGEHGPGAEDRLFAAGVGEILDPVDLINDVRRFLRGLDVQALEEPDQVTSINGAERHHLHGEQMAR